MEGNKNHSWCPLVLSIDGRGERISSMFLSTKSLTILYKYINFDPPQKHLRCKKGAPKKLQVPGTQCKKKKKKKTAQLK